MFQSNRNGPFFRATHTHTSVMDHILIPSDHSLDDIMNNIQVRRMPSFSSSDFDHSDLVISGEKPVQEKPQEPQEQPMRRLSFDSTFDDDIDLVLAGVPLASSVSSASSATVSGTATVTATVTATATATVAPQPALQRHAPVPQSQTIPSSSMVKQHVLDDPFSECAAPFNPPNRPPTAALTSSPYFPPPEDQSPSRPGRQTSHVSHASRQASLVTMSTQMTGNDGLSTQQQLDLSLFSSPDRVAGVAKRASHVTDERVQSPLAPTKSPLASLASAKSPIASQVEWLPSSRELYGYNLHKLNLRQKAELKVYKTLSNPPPGCRVKRTKTEEDDDGDVVMKDVVVKAETVEPSVPAELVKAEAEPAELGRVNLPRNAKTQARSNVLQQLEYFNSSNKRPVPVPGVKKTRGKIQARLYVTENKPVMVDTEKDGLMTVEVASLSAEQQEIHDMVVGGKVNIFFTGAAGTGKSVLLRQIIASLKRKFHSNLEKVAVTASTGLAACNVQGTTLHSFAGCGLARENVDDLCRKIRRNKKASNRWKKVEVLVIDEISMVDARFFDKLEAIARKLRRNQQPFGGIQIIITGDFYQLPPVPDNHKKQFAGGSYQKHSFNSGMVDKRSVQSEADLEARFAFEAESWPAVIDDTFLLTKVFRQKDPTFANMLNQLRTQTLDDASLEGFQSLARPLHVPDGITPTELFPTRREVERSNVAKMGTLKGKLRCFDAMDTGAADEDMRQKLLENLMVPRKLNLKAGSQVMMLKNMDPNLVNGSIGVVIGFMSPRTFITAEELADEGELKEDEAAMKKNIYNLSTEAELQELARLVEAGGGVADDSAVAIDSQAESPYFDSSSDCVFERLRGFPEDARNATFVERKLERRRKLDELAKKGKYESVYPVVRFRRMDHTFRNVLLHPETFAIENIDGDVLASRTQIPLILAWALSIHKAQGQTLQYVKVDLAKTFERGQAYVALSRATSKEGLQVLNFLPDKVRTHPKVVEFYKTLRTYNDENVSQELGAQKMAAAM